MDPKSRILPHLNVYFLQRKAYQQHRKKIEIIRCSITKPKLKKTVQEIEEKGENATQTKEAKVPNKYSLHTIKEQIKHELASRLSPWAKRLKEEAQKQNNRLYGKIQKCSSTISRRQIQNHRIKNEEIKERLSKFVYSPFSHKTLLKCKHSLQIIRQKEKRRDEGSELASRNPSRMRYSKSEISQIDQQHGKSQRLSFSTQPIQKKGSFDRFYLLRNQSKIRSHFQKKSDFSSQSMHSTDFQSKKRMRTQIRRNRNNKCFTTQVQGD